MTSPYLNTKAAAAYLGIDVKTFYNLTYAGKLKLPCYPVGDGPRARKMYKASELEAYMESRRVAQ